MTIEVLKPKKEYTHFYNNQILISTLEYITIAKRIKNIIVRKVQYLYPITISIKSLLTLFFYAYNIFPCFLRFLLFIRLLQN